MMATLQGVTSKAIKIHASAARDQNPLPAPTAAV
jgi:hypothetical protein